MLEIRPNSYLREFVSISKSFASMRTSVESLLTLNLNNKKIQQKNAQLRQASSHTFGSLKYRVQISILWIGISSCWDWNNRFSVIYVYSTPALVERYLLSVPCIKPFIHRWRSNKDYNWTSNCIICMLGLVFVYKHVTQICINVYCLALWLFNHGILAVIF